MSLSLIYQCQCQRALLTSRAMSSFVEMPHSLRRRAVSRRLRAQRRRARAVSFMRKPPDRRGPPRENRLWLCLPECLGLCPLCGIGRRGSGSCWPRVASDMSSLHAGVNLLVPSTSQHRVGDVDCFEGLPLAPNFQDLDQVVWIVVGNLIRKFTELAPVGEGLDGLNG